MGSNIKTMKKESQSTRIDKTLLVKVRKLRGRLTIQGFIEQAIEERISKLLKTKG